jgi:hypothetical protein
MDSGFISVLALSVVCALLLVIYICTVFYLCMRKVILQNQKARECNRTIFRGWGQQVHDRRGQKIHDRGQQVPTWPRPWQFSALKKKSLQRLTKLGQYAKVNLSFQVLVVDTALAADFWTKLSDSSFFRR